MVWRAAAPCASALVGQGGVQVGTKPDARPGANPGAKQTLR